MTLSSNRAYLLTLLVMVYTSNYVDRVIIGVVGQALKTDLHLTDSQLGLLNGMAFILFYAMMGIPLGRLADRWNRKRLLSACLALWSAMTALSGFAGSFAQLMAARVGVGIGEAGSTPIGHSMIADSFPPERRATAVSIFGAGAPMGVLIGTIGGGWVAQHYGWRAAMMAVGLPGLLLAILILATVREPERGRLDAADKQAPIPFREAMHILLADPLFRHVAIGLGCAAVAVYSISSFAVPLLMRAYDLSLFGAASAFGLSYGLAGVVGSFIGGVITDRASQSDPRWSAGVPAIVYSTSCLFLITALYAQDYLMFVALFTVGAVLLYIGLAPALSVLLTRFAPRMRGSVSALTLLVTNLIGLGLGPVLSGIFSDAFASHAYRGAGDYGETCVQALSGAAQALCEEASFIGLQRALAVVILFLIVAALIYLSAARHLRPAIPAQSQPDPAMGAALR